MIVSFFRNSYFSADSERFPSRVENVIICGPTADDIRKASSQPNRADLGEFRRETVGPLSTDTSLLAQNIRQVNWRDLENIVRNADQKTEYGPCGSFLFIDRRQIELLGGPIKKVINPDRCCDPAESLLDIPLETVYLFSAYDHSNHAPIAPIYLMKTSSFRNALITVFAAVVISEFDDFCICKCDRMLIPQKL
jgi:hypothetical protein